MTPPLPFDPFDPRSEGFNEDLGYVPCRADECFEDDGVHPWHETRWTSWRMPRTCPQCNGKLLRDPQTKLTRCVSCSWSRTVAPAGGTKTRRQLKPEGICLDCSNVVEPDAADVRGRRRRGRLVKKVRCNVCLAAARVRAKSYWATRAARVAGEPSSINVANGRSRCRRCSSPAHYAKTCCNPGVLREV